MTKNYIYIYCDFTLMKLEKLRFDTIILFHIY